MTSPALLSEKERLFVAEYIRNGGNATRAAHAAGYALSHAHVQGCQLLKKPNVRALLAEKLGEHFDKHDISAERVLQELARIAFGNAADVLTLNDLGDWELNLAELDDNQRALIKSIKRGEHGVEVTTNDKLQALQLLGKYLKLFIDVTESNVNIGLGERLLKAQLRAQLDEFPEEEEEDGSVSDRDRGA